MVIAASLQGIALENHMPSRRNLQEPLGRNSLALVARIQAHLNANMRHQGQETVHMPRPCL